MLTVSDGLADVAAAALAASKLVPVAAPYWAKLPKWLQPTLPVMVLNVPLVLASLFGVATGENVLTMGVMSLMLFLPGLKHAATVAKADAKIVWADGKTLYLNAVSDVKTVADDAVKATESVATTVATDVEVGTKDAVVAVESAASAAVTAVEDVAKKV